MTKTWNIGMKVMNRHLWCTNVAQIIYSNTKTVADKKDS